MHLFRKENEIGRLVKKLTSRKKTEVDAAKARLIIIGTRAVEHLINALDGENSNAKIQAMSILSLIRDQRAKNPLIAMLLDRNPKIRMAAVHSLSKFPTDEVILSIKKLLYQEKIIDVKVAAIHSLVAMIRNGFDNAMSPVLEVIFNTKEPSEVRMTSFSILPFLKITERKAILKRLKTDPDRKVVEKAQEYENAPLSSEGMDSGEINKSIEKLASADYEELNEAIQHLISSGKRCIDPLVQEMVRRENDAEFCSRVTMVLKGLSPNHLKSLVSYLDSINELLPLRIIVDVIGSLDDKSLLYRLRGLIDRINSSPELLNNTSGTNSYKRIKARAHLQLAKAGSRMAIDDLKENLIDQNGHIDLDLLSSLEYIGKKEELPYLVKAFVMEDDWTKERIKEVFSKIKKRERIRKNNKIFKAMAREGPSSLQQLLH
jgi:HEAT repeat protein